MSLEIVNPASLGAPKGYSHGVLGPVGGRVLFVAGQPGWDASEKGPVPGFVQQFARALDRVLEVVREAGGGPEHVARMTVYVTGRNSYRVALEPWGACGASGSTAAIRRWRWSRCRGSWTRERWSRSRRRR